MGRIVRVAELADAEQPEAYRALLGRAPRSVEELYAVAEQNQGRLKAAAEEIAGELGEDVVLADPGVKARARVEEKMADKGRSAGEVTDVVRLGFMVRSPELAARIIGRLGQRFEVLDEGVTVTGMGYVDHKALVRFDNGQVGEVQLWDPEIAEAKFGRGEELYREVRTISAEDMVNDPALGARLAAAEAESREVYASALARASTEWRRTAMMLLPEDMRARVQELVEAGEGVGGRGGAEGNISRNLFRESSEPDSSTSTGATRDQTSSPSDTNRASTPPPGTSRTTAGRNSQLKNRSAIDAPPRSIVRQAVDERTGTPDATRTGTVPDTEYETVMARFADLTEDRGQFATIATEVDGELVERAARTVVDELDAAEDTLERIRVCSMPQRAVE